MIYFAFTVAVVAIIRLVTAIIGGISRASDLTYYLCRPLFFPMRMMGGFLGWLALFGGAGWAVKYIITYFL